MHTCLTVMNVDTDGYVERELAGLTAALSACCDSIRSCDIRIAGPDSDAAARSWRVDVRVHVFDETVRAMALASAGTDPQRSLAGLIADICASIREQLALIAERHHGCCAQCAPLNVARA